MLTEIFGDTCKRTKVIDLLLTHPDSEYTKKDIAEIAEISRTTLDTFIMKLLEIGIVKKTRKYKNGHLYQINLDSPITKALDSFQNQLADIEIEKQMKQYSKESGKDIKPIRPFEEIVKRELAEKEIDGLKTRTTADPNLLIFDSVVNKPLKSFFPQVNATGAIMARIVENATLKELPLKYTESKQSLGFISSMGN